MIKLSGYKILKKIGTGGMGDVFLATHEVLEKKVAIKSLHANLVNDESFKKRFRREAKVHSKLNHPNIVKLIDFQERKDGLFIVMEYVRGKQLDDYIYKDSGPIPEKDLLPIFMQILSAISHAHSKGLVHRDIKPANVIIYKGKIKVLDFGIAKEISTESGLTKTGVQVGTPMYMSPEQVNGEHIDKLTDIYSLGVTLFYMSVGKPPYENSNIIKMGIKIISDPFPKSKEFYPGVSDKIEAIINKATQKKKIDRYQSCNEFIQALKSDKIEKENKALSISSVIISFVAILFFAFLSMAVYEHYFDPSSDSVNIESNDILDNLVVKSSDEINKLEDEKKRIDSLAKVKEKEFWENLNGDDIDSLLKVLDDRAEREYKLERRRGFNDEKIKNKAQSTETTNKKEEKKSEHLSDLKSESSKYFKKSGSGGRLAELFGEVVLTDNARSLIMSNIDMSSLLASKKVIKVLLVDNRFLVILTEEKKPNCRIYDLNNPKSLSSNLVFSDRLKGEPYSWYYCKYNMILCSDQNEGIGTIKNYINLNNNTFQHKWKKYKKVYHRDCRMQNITKYNWE